MVYLSEFSIVKKYFDLVNESNIDHVLEKLEALVVLIKKYKKLIAHPNMIKEIQNLDNDLADFIMIFYHLKKLNQNSINKIISLLKKQFPNYKKTININTGLKNIDKDIHSILKIKFANFETDFKEVPGNTGILIAGDGYFYKRNLDTDLNKMI